METGVPLDFYFLIDFLEIDREIGRETGQFALNATVEMIVGLDLIDRVVTNRADQVQSLDSSKRLKNFQQWN